MIIGVHQPNYLPWLGYFAKLAASDVFVLLDDVQFSRGSYTNRAQIDRNGKPAWLTVPVRHSFGATIGEIATDGSDFARVHLENLRQCYRGSAAFAEVWPVISMLLGAPRERLADMNETLIRDLAGRLGLTARIVRSSDLHVPPDEADKRLVAIVKTLSEDATYLSGRGGDNYQDPAVFAASGIALRYTAFDAAPYPRSGRPFLRGLSIVDALFHLGFDGTRGYLKSHPA